MYFFLIVVSCIFTFLYFSYANIKKGVYSQVMVCGEGFKIQGVARGSQAGILKIYK